MVDALVLTLGAGRRGAAGSFLGKLCSPHCAALQPKHRPSDAKHTHQGWNSSVRRHRSARSALGEVVVVEDGVREPSLGLGQLRLPLAFVV